ncbi:MAG TPA: hypothetical protein VII01_04925 [Solirubrobacteraceae bacterium]|jgi:hypothetical protein
MARAPALDIELLPGAPRLLELHARELPQRDDLCGAFCGALALGAAGFDERAGEPLDQDAVAVAAGSFISATPQPDILPQGETGRRDYRLAIPRIADGEESGTTAAGVLDAVAALADGELTTIPYAGPWTSATLTGMFDAAAACERPVTLIANLATHHLWGSRASIPGLLGYLLDGDGEGPAPDWRVGHFVCVVGRVRGPGGTLYVLTDTYPSLGSRGVHMQPQEHLARALERSDMPAGGVIAVAFAGDADALRAAAAATGLTEGIWDNGTVAAEGKSRP